MTKTEIRDSLVKQLELRGMNAEFYKDMIDDYVYYWSLKKKLISDIKSKGLTQDAYVGLLTTYRLLKG